MEDLLALVVPRGLLKRRKPPRVSFAEPSQEDLDQIEELRIQGSRLKVPHPVRAFVTFKEEKSARAGMEFFAKEGFRCTLRADAADCWTVVGIITLVPDPKVITWLREQMASWTGELDGTYLGWDAPIVA